MVVTVKLPLFCMNNISEWGLPCKGQQQDNGSNYFTKSDCLLCNRNYYYFRYAISLFNLSNISMN